MSDVDWVFIGAITGAVLVLGAFSVGSYYFVKYCCLLERRAWIKKPVSVSVIIAEKVVEEEKQEAPPERILTKKDRLKMRQAEEKRKFLEAEIEFKAAERADRLGIHTSGAMGSVDLGDFGEEGSDSGSGSGGGLFSCFKKSGASRGGGAFTPHSPIKPESTPFTSIEFADLEGGEGGSVDSSGVHKKKKKKHGDEKAKEEEEADPLVNIHGSVVSPSALARGDDILEQANEELDEREKEKLLASVRNREAAKAQEQKKEDRRNKKIRDKENTEAAEAAAIALKALEDRLAAESHEQKAQRKKDSHDRHERERREKEERRENERREAVTKSLDIFYERRRSNLLPTAQGAINSAMLNDKQRVPTGVGFGLDGTDNENENENSITITSMNTNANSNTNSNANANTFGLSVGMDEAEAFEIVEEDTGTVDEYGDPNAVSLFDVDPERIQRDIVHRRLDRRLHNKQQLIRDGKSDPVLTNAGPPLTIIPPGYISEPLAPELTLKALNHKRIMVLFNEPKATGWFQGTISGVSRRPGFNFSVKYDKADTGSIDVDGIKAASLVMEGEMAYGRGWVVLGEDPHYTGIRPGTASRPPSRVNNF